MKCTRGRGGDATVRGSVQATPAEAAERNGHHEVVDFLDAIHELPAEARPPAQGDSTWSLTAIPYGFTQ